ncbi:hypothetical protein QAD02_008027 [Eretmocerus hayati]|uniref:Uncharacterized protein n=1 Tax=Eretmocerus hayati TaxID=131215 RepID=A0ACC2N5A7_9HYME|nr:hypothetical protein QAD02_008027 [Eretmocerus hayati]
MTIFKSSPWRVSVFSDGEEQRLLASERKHKLAFMIQNPTYYDGVVIVAGIEQEKQVWIRFVTQMQQNGLTRKSSDKLLCCWLGAMDRMLYEARTGVLASSREKQRMFKLCRDAILEAYK